jgi:hypothetical protein
MEHTPQPLTTTPHRSRSFSIFSVIYYALVVMIPQNMTTSAVIAIKRTKRSDPDARSHGCGVCSIPSTLFLSPFKI